MVVRKYLVSKFKVDDTRLKTMGTGEAPDSQTPAGGRVDIKVYAVSVEPPPLKFSPP